MSDALERNFPINNKAHIMSEETILSFLQAEQEKGTSEAIFSKRKRAVNALYGWLPAEKAVTKEVLQAWRQDLHEKGYSAETVLDYVKGINRYLNYVDRADLLFQRGRAKDLTGKQFGYLTALEVIGQKARKDYIWRCQCKCGNEIELSATSLLTGNTRSCGCLRAEHLMETNKYIEGTSIRQALDEKVESKHSKSGYTGITMKNGKWRAQIFYKGQYYSLGYYSNLEDAVKARARAKELIQEDAMALLVRYHELHNDNGFDESKTSPQ